MSDRAASDLAFIRDVIHRTDQRTDPHAFHYVHWGAIVLVWYPLSNWFALQERHQAMVWLGAAALLLGAVLSVTREFLLARSSRSAGGHTFVSRQIVLVTFGALGMAAVLSAVGPATRFIDGSDVPVIWGLAYAVLAYGLGVVYRRMFLYAGLGIFAAVVLAICFPNYNGFILGPAMGLGLLVPGLLAERRVSKAGDDARA